MKISVKAAHVIAVSDLSICFVMVTDALLNNHERFETELEDDQQGVVIEIVDQEGNTGMGPVSERF